MPPEPDPVVSDVAAFVMDNGALAEELLFGDTELPGLSKAEHAAIERVEDHLEHTWLGILCASREAVWSMAGGRSKLGKALRTRKRRDATIWKRDGVEMPLVVDPSWRATCGVSLEVWAPNPRYALRAWVWTQAGFRDAARDATRGIPKLKVHGNGPLQWLDFGTPKAGDRYEDLARTAAEGLWSLAQPIGTAVLNARGGE